jgi:ankyrin repeat protein
MISIEHWNQLYIKMKEQCSSQEPEFLEFISMIDGLDKLISGHPSSDNKNRDIRKIVLLENDAWEFVKGYSQLFSNVSQYLVTLFEEIYKDEFLVSTIANYQALVEAVKANSSHAALDILQTEVGVIWRKEFCARLCDRFISSSRDSAPALVTIGILENVNFDFNTYDMWGNTLIGRIADGGENIEKTQRADIEVIKALMKVGADINKPNKNQQLPLKAVLNHKPYVADFLLSNGAATYPGIINDIILGSNVVYFLEKVREIFGIECGSEPIPYVPSNNYGLDKETLEYCLDKGMRLDHYSLADKVILESPQAVSLCIERGDGLNLKIDAEKYQLKHPFFKENADYYLPHYVACYASPESLACLITAGLDIELKDSFGRTMLHYIACHHDFYDRHCIALKKLLCARALIDVQDQSGKTPLHYAVEYQRHKAAEILIYAGADTSKKDFSGKKAFDYESDLGRKYDLSRLKPKSNSVATSMQCSSLLMWTAYRIIEMPEHMTNLSYRKRLPKEVSAHIDNIAEMQFTPPKFLL